MKIYRILLIIFIMQFLTKGCGYCSDAHSTNSLNTTYAISIGNIISDVNNGALSGRDNRHLVIRRNIISDLTEKYNCQVLSRSWGSDILLEQAINRMTLIDQVSIPQDMIPAADFIIKVNIADIAGKMMIHGSVYCIDIRTEKIVSTKASFSANSIFEVPQKVCDCVAKMLSLKNRTDNIQPKSGHDTKKRVWAVLPFAFYSRSDQHLHTEYLHRIENVLLLDKSLGRIVERATIDNILAEHNIYGIDGSDMRTSTSIARLLKADLLLTGDVSKWGGGLRANFYVLDGRNGCIVAASSTKAKNWKELNKLSVDSVNTLVHSIGFLPDIRKSTHAQRLREAENLVKSNPFFVPPSYDRNLSHITLESATSAAEGAYLLVGTEEPEFIYRTMKSLLFKYANNAHSVFWDSISLLPSTKRALNLIDISLAGIPNISGTPSTTLLRAEAYLLNNMPEKAIKLINKELLTNPTSKYALYLKADYLFRSGKIIEAATLAEKVNVGFRLRNAIENKMNIIADREAKKLSERDAYNRLRKIFGSTERIELYRDDSPWGLAQAISEYLTLMRKFETPDECLRQAGQRFGSADSWKWQEPRHNYPVLLHCARCHYKLGNMQEAGAICSRLVEVINMPAYYHYKPYQTIKKQALKLLKDIGNRYTPENDTWKNLKQVNPIPDKYKIYIVPVGIMHEETLSEAVKHLSLYYGIQICVLPLVAAPEASVPKEGCTYLPKEMMTGLLQTVKIPDDALYLAFVTDLHLVRHITFGEIIDHKLAVNPLLISIADCPRREPKPFMQMYARLLAWRIIKSFDFAHEQINGITYHAQIDRIDYEADKRCPNKRCLNFPCVFSSTLNNDIYTGRDRLFRMCEACQKKRKNYDYNKMHRTLIRRLKKAGAKIVDPSEVEFTVVEPDKKQDAKENK